MLVETIWKSNTKLFIYWTLSLLKLALMNSALIILIDKSDNEDTAEFFDTSDRYFPGTKNNLQCIYTEYMIYTYIFIDLNSYQDEGSLEIEHDKISTVEIAGHPVERSQMGNYVWCDIYFSVVKGSIHFSKND